MEGFYYKMKNFFSKIKETFMQGSDSEEEVMEEEGEEYVEIDTERAEEATSKIIVRPFTISDFDDIKPILDSLREGNTVSIINIKPLKDKEIVELKRAINKLKKTCDAIEGEIAGFGEDYIVATPAFAHIHKGHETTEVKKEEPAAPKEPVEQHSF